MSESAPRSPQWKWYVCGLLLLATMLLYMDRQTLAQTSSTITRQVGIDDLQYGRLEFGFGMAFAFGALFFGIVVDRVDVRKLYPFVLVCWSLTGVATAFSTSIGAWLVSFFDLSMAPDSWLWRFTQLSEKQAGYTDAERVHLMHTFLGLFACRVVLGVFEAGHWPCALVTTQRILERKELPLGNSILQSGASIGAIFTPWVVLIWNMDVEGNWRWPFVAVGLLGLMWIVPWFMLVRKEDLARPPQPPPTSPADASTKSLATESGGFLRKFFACLIIVIMINLTWQFYRAWLPRFLTLNQGYSEAFVGIFTSFYYVSSDIGCIAVGVAVRWLSTRHWDVHNARLLTFGACVLITSLGFVIAVTPASPLLLFLLLLVAAGSLGLFPNYYAFSQDLSRRHQGKITGTLGFCTWIASAIMQESVGQYVRDTGSYVLAIRLAAAAPIIALVALLLLWRPTRKASTPDQG